MQISDADSRTHELTEALRDLVISIMKENGADFFVRFCLMNDDGGETGPELAVYATANPQLAQQVEELVDQTYDQSDSTRFRVEEGEVTDVRRSSARHDHGGGGQSPG